MEIQNLNSAQPKNNLFSLPILFIIIILAVTSGFWVSRLFPATSTNPISGLPTSQKNQAVSADNISNASQLEVGKLYGNLEKEYKDTATGTLEKGNINGEGTHILSREGGLSQRVSLTSSAVDLDLFVGKKVEVKGQTNSSTKTGWLMDVGAIKIIE
jgi:hypothetical protein